MLMLTFVLTFIVTYAERGDGLFTWIFYFAILMPVAVVYVLEPLYDKKTKKLIWSRWRDNA